MIARLEGLERRVQQLERQRAVATGSEPAPQPIADQVRTLRELFEYAVLRPVDMVKLDGDPYFWYVNDMTYGLFAEHSPHTFIRNYRLSEDDLKSAPPFGYSVEEFLATRRHEFPRNEQYAKFVIFAHLWKHKVDFSMLDIGANVGYTSIPCAKFIRRFCCDNPIYAFEPGISGELLKANIELNKVADLVHPEFMAVSDRCGPVKMTSMLGHSVCDSIGDFRRYYPHLVPATTRIVNAVTIDQFVRERGIDQSLVLKIDAEGHDWQVLQGARETLGRGQVAATIIEFVPHYLKEFVDPAQLLIDLSRDNHLLYILDLLKGYHWAGRVLPSEPERLREFAQQVARSPLTYTDIVAISKRAPDAKALVKDLAIEC